MADWTDEQIRQKVLDTLDEVGAFVNNSDGEPDIAQVETVDDSISLPGVQLDAQGKVVRYVMAKMTVFATYASNAVAAIQATWNAWFGADANSGVRKTWSDWYAEAQSQWSTLKGDSQSATAAANAAADDWNKSGGYKEQIVTATQDASTAAQDADASRALIEAGEQTRQSNEQTRQDNESLRQGNESTRTQNEQDRVSAEQGRVTTFNGDHTTATQDHSTATQDHTMATQDHTTAIQDHSTATQDHAASVTATSGAEKVNAMLGGTGGIVTLTVIDRTGASKTKEVGFRIAKTYATVAAMNADAANVEEGRFVLIASDVEDPHNAEMYVKGASSFTFLTDLSGSQGIKGDTPVMTASSDGILYADGEELTRIIKNSVDAFVLNEGSLSGSQAGDGSRWGAYKSAEAGRDSQYSDAEDERDGQYSTAENTRDTQYGTAENARDGRYQTAENARDAARQNAEGTSSSTAGDGTRWGAYKSAEAARNTSYAGEEGSSTSTAGDGTRWGAFKSNETQRQDSFDAAQASRDTTWTNWFSDTLATGVRKIWSTWYNATVTAWDSWFGTSSSTGVQGDWTTLRADVVDKTDAADTAARNADNKAALADTKATEAERVNASLSGTTLTVTDRNGQSASTDLKGDTGEAAGFGTPQASVSDNTPGTPAVTVTATGDDTAKVFSFTFSHIKGDKGDGLNWDTMTPEDKEAVINTTAQKVEEEMIFASIQTCEDIIDELT